MIAYAQVNDPPRRVVSMNLCTDQLVMMLADPDQLLSVFHLSHDPHSSVMATEAQNYIPNHGLAEEIYLMQPDLVVAGRFSSTATVSMLRRLGVPVAILDPAYSLSDIPAHILDLGAQLGQEAKARRIVADFNHDLTRLRAAAPSEQPLAALYYANGYTSGGSSLAGEMLEAAGFRNAAVEAGLSRGGIFPLEMLALSDPDALITGQRFPAASRSEEILDHPVVETLKDQRMQGSVTDRNWVCGTPHVLRAISGLAALNKTEDGK